MHSVANQKTIKFKDLLRSRTSRNKVKNYILLFCLNGNGKKQIINNHVKLVKSFPFIDSIQIEITLLM